MHQDIILEKKKEILINEVGESSKRPFRYKRDLKPYEGEGSRYDYEKGEWIEKPNAPRYHSRKEKRSFQYEFKTKSGFVYEVSIDSKIPRYDWTTHKKLSDEEWNTELAYIYNTDRKTYINLRKMGATRDDFGSIWHVGFRAVDGPQEEVTTTSTWYDGGERTYSTTKLQSEENRGEFFKIMATITKIIKDHLKKHGGRLIHFAPLDDRRGRVFTRYILQQIPNSKMWVDGWKQLNDFYFYLNV